MSRAGVAAACPPWCVTEHPRYDFHGSRTVLAEPAIGVQALDADVLDRPVVSVWVPGMEQLWTEPDDAGKLAALVDALAEATPEQHAALAAEIRRTAALIRGAK